MDALQMFLNTPPTNEQLYRCLRENPSECSMAGMIPWLCGHYEGNEPKFLVLYATDPDTLYDNVSDELTGFRIFGHILQQGTS